MASVTIKSAGEQYAVTLSRPISVTGDSSQFAKVLASLVEGMLEDYSPAFGEPAAYVAENLKKRLGVTVVSIDAPPLQEGVVY